LLVQSGLIWQKINKMCPVCRRQIKHFIKMKHILIDKTTGEGNIYSCKTDIAKQINVSVRTLNRWQNKTNMINYKQFIICFDATIHKAMQKANNQFNNNM